MRRTPRHVISRVDDTWLKHVDCERSLWRKSVGRSRCRWQVNGYPLRTNITADDRWRRHNVVRDTASGAFEGGGGEEPGPLPGRQNTWPLSTAISAVKTIFLCTEWENSVYLHRIIWRFQNCPPGSTTRTCQITWFDENVLSSDQNCTPYIRYVILS